MKNWKQFLVNKNYSILKALELINSNDSQFVMVSDESGVLLGTVTDGDVRRGLIKGYQTQDPVFKIMNSKPISFKMGAKIPQMEKFMKKKGINHVPFLDENGRIVDVISLKELNLSTTKENTVVLMAGGLGSRLSSLTQNFPKPMLEVGGKPILENIIDIFKENGFSDFVISLNYKSEIIESYFQNGEKFGVKIRYLKEEKPLGTAGALSLFEPKNDLPFIVMNGDLLTKLNFGELLNFHNFRKNDVTMCLRQYEHQVPFGVITTNGERAIKIEEKPTKTYLVNGGIYVLNPGLLKRIPKNTYFDMTTFFDELISGGERVGAFPFYEYWIDIGRLDDFEKAHKDFIEVFKPKM